MQPIAFATLIDVGGNTIEANPRGLLQRNPALVIGLAIQRNLGDLLVLTGVVKDIEVPVLSSSASSKILVACNRTIGNLDLEISASGTPIVGAFGD